MLLWHSNVYIFHAFGPHEYLLVNGRQHGPMLDLDFAYHYSFSIVVGHVVAIVVDGRAIAVPFVRPIIIILSYEFGRLQYARIPRLPNS